MESESTQAQINFLKSLDYAELFKDSFSHYGLIELSSVKQITPITSAKDLEREAKSISEILRDVKSK